MATGSRYSQPSPTATRTLHVDELCKVCGWRFECEAPETCPTNRRNVDLYCLRYKREPRPQFVRSVRWQELDEKKAKGGLEHLVIVDREGNEISKAPLLTWEYVNQ